jgi:hypothetical protein
MCEIGSAIFLPVRESAMDYAFQHTVVWQADRFLTPTDETRLPPRVPVSLCPCVPGLLCPRRPSARGLRLLCSRLQPRRLVRGRPS